MNSRKVMIVDDDLEFLEELNDTLVSSGYEVVIESDPEKVVSRVAATSPEVVVLDLNMPRMSGFRVADELARAPGGERLKIVAMTGHYTEKEHFRLMRHLGIRVLVKPFTPLDVIAKIEDFA